ISESKEDKLVKVVLQNGQTVVAKSMILAPGAWTNQVMEQHFGMTMDLDIWRIHWAHYEIDENVDVPQCFFFRKESECGNDGGLYYCFPTTATESCQATPGKKIVKVGHDGWIRDLSIAKSRDLCQKANNDAKSILKATDNVYADNKKDPIGKSFPDWIKENSKVTDCVVLGGGMAGTAAAYANSKAGIKTLLVEQGDSLAPKTGSSNGDSRMYRQMYSNSFFSKMQTAALDQWSILEKEAGEQLLHQNGLLFYGEDTGETVEGSVQGARDTMKELGLPHEYFATGDDIAEQFPALKTKSTPYSGVYEETAGHVRSSAACAAMARVAEQSGLSQTITNCKVTDISESKEDKLVKVVLQDGQTVVAKSMILAPGAWTNQVMEQHFGMTMDLDIWRIHWAHYEIDENVDVPQCFFFRKESECGNDGGLYYCFPTTAT
ncbi:MAG: hypothetical protein SGARI_005358, partial [Bacillariaceae sp.]